jgi:hypothetical protein
MRYLSTILTLLFVAYLTSPLWENPVSDYVDVSFLETIDAQVIKGYELLKDQPFIEHTIEDLSQTIATLPEKITLKKNETSYATVTQETYFSYTN